MGETVRVIAFGKEECSDVEPLGEDKAYASEGGLDAGRVGVVDDGDIARKAHDGANLLLRERCARGRHDVFHSGLMHGNDVHIALDHYGFIFFCNSALRLVQPVDFLFFGIYR